MVQVARRPAVLLAVAVALIASSAACAGPGAPASGPSAATTRTAPPAPIGAIGSPDCDDSALLQAPGEALSVFPDNPGVEWTARPTDLMVGELVLVGLTPEPDEVGYAEFRFLYRCDPSGPVRIASYALTEGRFVLLATSDALADEELPLELEWSGAETVD